MVDSISFSLAVQGIMGDLLSVNEAEESSRAAVFPASLAHTHTHADTHTHMHTHRLGLDTDLARETTSGFYSVALTGQISPWTDFLSEGINTHSSTVWTPLLFHPPRYLSVCPCVLVFWQCLSFPLSISLSQSLFHFMKEFSPLLSFSLNQIPFIVHFVWQC